MTRAFAVAAAWVGGLFTTPVLLDIVAGRHPANLSIAIGFTVVALGMVPHD